MDSSGLFYITLISHIIILVLYMVWKWCRGGRCYSKSRLDGKTVVITGANAGIGCETAIDLAKRGATVVMACRDVQRGESAMKLVKERSGSSKVHLKILDLASLVSIRQFATSFLQEYEKLNLLINNAGVFMCSHTKTVDGFEMTIGVNHFGHFALTNLLLERIVESAPSRIVNVSSKSHGECGSVNFDDINSEKSFNRFSSYSQSKLANVLFTKELHRKIEGTGVTVYTLHPGVIHTEIARNVPSQWLVRFYFTCIFLILKTMEEGAQTTIYCAVEEGIEHQSGLYFSDCAVKTSSKKSYDEGTAKKLWYLSEELTGIKFPL